LEQLLQNSQLGGDRGDAVMRPDSGDVADAERTRSALAGVPAAHGVRGLAMAPAARAYVDDRFESAHGVCDYRLYRPAVRRAAASSLVVMLHGAGQDAADFAAGTRMHAHPTGDSVFVVYPSQKRDVPGRCWNWFRESDQLRGRGEPALLAALTRQVADAHGISPRRVFVAGMSAGAAMAVVLGRVYPDVYAAVGAHSGLAYQSATDMYAAFDVMSRGPAPASAARRANCGVPTIVFHGDADRTVHPTNAMRIAADAACGFAGVPGAAPPPGAGARGYSTTVFRDVRGRARVEQWIVEGGEHAWAGGSPDGSHTDASGPDATGEMLRFFRSHALAPRCAA
jgi:poly(hydroxyalkanoate) depolymerase family esterase